MTYRTCAFVLGIAMALTFRLPAEAQSAASPAPQTSPLASPEPQASPPASAAPQTSPVASPALGAPKPPKPAAPTPVPTATPTPGPPFSNMQWREIGPATAGGRVAAVAGTAASRISTTSARRAAAFGNPANGGQTWDRRLCEATGRIDRCRIAIDPTDEQDGLGRNGRDQSTQRRELRRRHLQDDRRRRHVDEPRV